MVQIFQVHSDTMDISQIISFHAPNKRYEIIDYSSNKMNVDYVNKKYPLFSIIIPNGQCVFTDITMELYKFKNIPNENTLYVVDPEENTYVLYDSSKFYVGRGKKINIWDEDISSNISSDISCNIEIKEKTFIESNVNMNLKKIIYETINFNLKPGKLINSFTINNYDKLYEKYGDIINDLIPYIENTEVDIKNRFNKMKVLKNVLSKDVCFWIINESEKKTWSDCKYPNYSTCVYIDNIPGVLNYVLFTCQYWIDHVRILYDMNIKLNIKDIFVAKNNDSQKRIEKCNDNSFIILNIQLNKNNESIIYNDDSIILEQGDMIVYNKKTVREKCNNYVLVLMIDYSV